MSSRSLCFLSITKICSWSNTGLQYVRVKSSFGALLFIQIPGFNTATGRISKIAIKGIMDVSFVCYRTFTGVWCLTCIGSRFQTFEGKLKACDRSLCWFTGAARLVSSGFIMLEHPAMITLQQDSKHSHGN